MASAHCAAELRRRGAEGSIAIVGREPEPPYERPPLSKGYLTGASSREDAYVHAPTWYDDNGVELLTRTNAMSLDADAKAVKLQGGEEVSYGSALIATGAMVNLLRVEGAALEGIHYLRAFGNADSIRDEAAEAERVVLIGGSYIATEVAASLRQMGKQCVLVMLEDVALSGSFGEQVGRHFDDLLLANGVEIHRGDGLEAFEGSGRVEAVVTRSGGTVEGDLVVVGAGVRADAMLAQRAGLAVGDGIECDSGLRTSAPDVFAAGDCCSYDSVLHGRRLRVEHWDAALNQGRHVAASMLGEARDYEVVPYFFSDLADWASLEYVGPAEKWDQVVIRGDMDEGAFSAWYIDGGRVVAALSRDRGEDLAAARSALASGVDVSDSLDRIADPESSLDDFLL